MDLIKKVIHAVTYPLWYIMILLMGNQKVSRAIENSKEDQKEGAGVTVERTQHPAKAFGVDQVPAQPITSNVNEDEGKSEELGDNSIEDLDRGDDLFPDSVKKTIAELQKELQETIKLKNQLKEAAERSRSTGEVVGDEQKISEQQASTQEPGAGQDVAESSMKAALEAAQSTQKELEEIAKTTEEVAKETFVNTRQTEQEAATQIQEAIEGTIKVGGQIIGQKNNEVDKKAGNLVGGSGSLQDELDEAVKSNHQDAKGSKDVVETVRKIDQETRERFKAVEQVGNVIQVDLKQWKMTSEM
ncbi:hypothetical protein BIW11_13117 [Tropilaelaps mercedesae]|uniref:Uncharacterized protein n=1 Tax=Tropilaelaps mercedesae TaxID=418985 RepID=A0A1V9X3Z9_9ACAR|nr:hypothetical protein BIW11_13117 [Tropilaelaps mercedesae]